MCVCVRWMFHICKSETNSEDQIKVFQTGFYKQLSFNFIFSSHKPHIMLSSGGKQFFSEFSFTLEGTYKAQCAFTLQASEIDLKTFTESRIVCFWLLSKLI